MKTKESNTVWYGRILFLFSTHSITIWDCSFPILKRSTRLRPRPFLSLLSVLFFYQVRILCETFPKYGIRRPWVIQGTISDTKMNVMLNKEEIKNLISVSSLISTLQIFCNVLVPFWNVWFWDRVQCSCKINDIMIFVGKGEAALLSQTHLQTTG